MKVKIQFIYIFLSVILKCFPAIGQTTEKDWKQHFEAGIEARETGLYKESVVHLELAFDNIKTNNNFTSANLSLVAKELNQSYFSIGNYQGVIDLYHYVLGHYRNKGEKNTAEFLEALGSLSVAHYIKGDHRQVIDLNLESLEITQIVFSKNHIKYGIGLINLASSYYSLGDYASTANILSQLEQVEYNLTSNSEYGNLCYMMGLIFSQLGNGEKAILYGEKSVKYTKDVDKLKLYRMHLNQYYKDSNRFEEVITFFNEELDHLRALEDTLNFTYRNLLLNLGDIYKMPGKFEQGLPYYLKALELTEQISGKPSLSYSYSQLELARYYIYFWKEKEALETLKTSLAGFDHDENQGLYSDILANLGTEFYFQKNYDAAIDNLQRAVETSDRDDFYLRRLIALSYRHKGDMETSAKLFEDLVAIIPPSNDEELYQARAFLSDVYQELGKPEKAFNLYVSINNDLLNDLETNFSFRNTQEKKFFLENMLYRLNKSQSFEYINGKAYPDVTEININNLLIQKGLLLNDLNNMLDELSSLEEEDVREEVFAYHRNKNQITVSLNAGLDENIIDSLQRLINENELKLSRLYYSKFPRKKEIIKSWKLVKEHLDKSEVAIEFSHFQYHDIKNWTDSIYYTAYIISAEEALPKYVKLFEVQQLKDVLKNFSPETLYGTRGSQAKTANSVKYNQEIYNLVWAKLEPFLEDVKTIYFAPDGLLHQIPFAALQGDGEKEVLCQKYDLIQLSSTNLLVNGRKDIFPGTTFLWGGIDYEMSTIPNRESGFNTSENNSAFLSSLNDSRSYGETWSYLPGTKVEVETLKNLLNSAGVNTEIFSGTAATEAEFKALDGNSPDVLHIASHGFFFENMENDAENEPKAKSQRFKIAKDPLQRSGLILAGANYVWKTGNYIQDGEDGILTALEVANLDLSSTGLVILSACETGLGDIEGSEGVYGLQRAFKMARVQALMMSLWQVPDKETAEFMEVFYSQWTKGMPARQAFLKTQKKMQKRYSDSPHKWAAFVMVE